MYMYLLSKNAGFLIPVKEFCKCQFSSVFSILLYILEAGSLVHYVYYSVLTMQSPEMGRAFLVLCSRAPLSLAV